MQNKEVNMRYYPLVRECYKYIVYDGLSWEDTAKIYNEDIADLINSDNFGKTTPEQIKAEFEQYEKDGGKLPRIKSYLTLGM